jgi:alcohol dehydrogenase (cytochrome c)
MTQKRKSFNKSLALTTLVAAVLAAVQVQAKEVTDADVVNDAKTPGDVVTAGIGQQGQRFSALAKVNTKTVKDLTPVWSMSFGGEKQRGQESQPLVFDGKMYVTASYSRLFALDPTASCPAATW